MHQVVGSLGAGEPTLDELGCFLARARVVGSQQQAVRAPRLEWVRKGELDKPGGWLAALVPGKDFLTCSRVQSACA